jgi:hypothetical protein
MLDEANDQPQNTGGFRERRVIGQHDLLFCLNYLQVLDNIRQTLENAVRSGGVETGDLIVVDPLPQTPAFVVRRSHDIEGTREDLR